MLTTTDPLCLIAAVGLAAALVACSSSPYQGPRLKALGSDAVSGELPSVKINQAMLMPMRALCTTGSPIRITKVTAAKPTGGLRVVDWGTRALAPHQSQQLGGQPGLVRDEDGFGHQPVSVKCAKDPVQFSVSVATSSARGTMAGVTLYYASGQTVFAQFAVALCATAACAPVPSS